MMKFSATTTAFYDDSLVYDPPIPEDAIEVSMEEFASAVAARSAGAVLSVESGVLVIGEAPAQTLAQAQGLQIAQLNAAYQVAITAPISFTTAAGTTSTFPQSDDAKRNLSRCITAGASAWSLNLWLDVNGQPITPFTYADLQGLAAAMETAEAPDFQELLTLVSQVSAATTVAAVQAIVWPSAAPA